MSLRLLEARAKQERFRLRPARLERERSGKPPPSVEAEGCPRSVGKAWRLTLLEAGTKHGKQSRFYSA